MIRVDAELTDDSLTAFPQLKSTVQRFWEVIWFIIVSLVFISYLMMLFNIIADMFRDPDLSGALKAIWMVAFIFLPLLACLAYLIARGGGMGRRQVEAAQRTQDRQEAYIKSVAGASPTDEISRGKSLLDSGAISQTEFNALKAKALA